MSQLFTSGGQSIGVSASASVLLMNIQDWFPLGLSGLISLQSKGLSSLLQHHSSKASILWRSAFFRVQLFSTPWTAARQVSLSITDSRSLLKLMSESVMPPNHLILCCPLLLAPSVFPSIRISSSESALCVTWPKYWSVIFSSNFSSEYSGLISFRMDWFDLLAVQGTPNSFPAPQFESINSLALSLL